ncbi:hypothetical protein OH77DRAFT_1198564 [Trametes cingulata]|nr:hypothetical protein OH77DRAFT_1198564 [Trametes cingulata]
MPLLGLPPNPAMLPSHLEAGDPRGHGGCPASTCLLQGVGPVWPNPWSTIGVGGREDEETARRVRAQDNDEAAKLSAALQQRTGPTEMVAGSIQPLVSTHLVGSSRSVWRPNDAEAPWEHSLVRFGEGIETVGATGSVMTPLKRCHTRGAKEVPSRRSAVVPPQRNEGIARTQAKP